MVCTENKTFELKKSFTTQTYNFRGINMEGKGSFPISKQLQEAIRNKHITPPLDVSKKIGETLKQLV